jgi:hypothetical protein
MLTLSERLTASGAHVPRSSKTLRGQDLEEDENVDEDEDGYWDFDEDPEGGADGDDDDTPADTNLPTLPDAEANPIELIDAGAEDAEDIKEIAPRASQHQRKKRSF